MMTSASVLEGFLTAEELGKQMRPAKSGRTILRWRERGILPPGVRIGAAIYYRTDAVREWLINLAEKAEGSAQPRISSRGRIHRGNGNSAKAKA